MLLRDMLARFCRKGSLWGRDRMRMPLLVYVSDVGGWVAGVM